MTNYPYGFDNNITLPGVSGSSQEDTAIKALRESTFAIEEELGITPSGIYPDVRTRLDILENRLNLGVSPIIPNDGYVKSPLFIWNVPQNVILTISDGYGAPTENRLNGSLYMRSDGYANSELYVRRGTSWFPMQSDLWVAGGDLSGTYLSQKVIGIRNKSLNVSLETVGATQDGYHLTWNNFGGYWEAQTGFIPSHDLTAFSGPYGRTGQTVTGIQGSHISPVSPTDGYTLVWSAADSAWEPQARAVIFDGYVSRVNLRSNRALQSPIDNTKTGIVNFGTKSTGASTGATDNYATILGGDRHSVSISYGVVGGGDSHTVSGQYGAILAGLTNLVSGQYAAVINGTGNQATQTQAVVLDGYSNLASATNSFVLNGGNNQAKANFSGILNGISNVITLGATHAGIGWGQSNSINANGISSVIMGGSGNQANAQNIFIGTPTGAVVSSNNSTVLTGINHTINSTSDHSVIVAGNTHTISASSGFSFIGTGNNLTATGLYATILNSTIGTVNGLHSLILNGNTNAVTASYSTVVNGRNNTVTIAGTDAHGTIVDGYSNTITGQGSFIGDGYNQTISGQFSSILNGNNNSIGGRNSTILNGSFNTSDASSAENTILVGSNNTHIATNNTVIIGTGNTLTNVSSHFVLGSNNTHQSNFSFTNGSFNTSLAGSSFNRTFGTANSYGANATINFVIGNSNSLGLTNTTSNSFISGSSNNIDGAGNGAIFGTNNIVTANFGSVRGQYGKSRLFGQQVQANARFTPGKIGEAQWSRLLLDGYGLSGTSILLQLQDTTQPLPTNPTFVDGYSYDMQIRVMIVNISPISPNPVVPARYVIDVLAHQDPTNTGILVLDNVNYTLSTPNTVDSPTRTPWTVTISPSGSQLLISVDSEIASSFVQPSGTASDRRAVATIEMREMSRL
jgi:hypothetical protein